MRGYFFPIQGKKEQVEKCKFIIELFLRKEGPSNFNF